VWVNVKRGLVPRYFYLGVNPVRYRDYQDWLQKNRILLDPDDPQEDAERRGISYVRPTRGRLSEPIDRRFAFTADYEDEYQEWRARK